MNPRAESVAKLSQMAGFAGRVPAARTRPWPAVASKAVRGPVSATARDKSDEQSTQIPPVAAGTFSRSHRKGGPGSVEMKHANVWVICSGLGLSLILGLVAPLEGLEPPDASRQTGVADFVSTGPCVPFVADDVRYAEVELRLDSVDLRPRFEF